MVTYDYNVGSDQNVQAATFQHQATGNYLQCQINENTGNITLVINNTKSFFRKNIVAVSFFKTVLYTHIVITHFAII